MKRWLWCLPAVAVLTLAGCGTTTKSGAPAARRTAATTTTSTTTTTPTTTTPTTTTPTTTTTVAATTTTAGASATTTTPPICATSQLSGSLIDPSGTAGSVDYQLELTNTSAGTCVVQGFPGVSFVAGMDGHQVGAAALRPANLTPEPVVLTSGESAYAPLAIAEAENFPSSSCQLTSVLGLHVYPPNEYTSLYIAHADQACANSQDPTLSIDPFYPKPTG